MHCSRLLKGPDICQHWRSKRHLPQLKKNMPSSKALHRPAVAITARKELDVCRHGLPLVLCPKCYRQWTVRGPSPVPKHLPPPPTTGTLPMFPDRKTPQNKSKAQSIQSEKRESRSVQLSTSTTDELEGSASAILLTSLITIRRASFCDIERLPVVLEDILSTSPTDDEISTASRSGTETKSNSLSNRPALRCETAEKQHPGKNEVDQKLNRDEKCAMKPDALAEVLGRGMDR